MLEETRISRFYSYLSPSILCDAARLSAVAADSTPLRRESVHNFRAHSGWIWCPLYWRRVRPEGGLVSRHLDLNGVGRVTTALATLRPYDAGGDAGATWLALPFVLDML